MLRVDAIQVREATGWLESGLGGHDGDSRYTEHGTASYEFSGLTSGEAYQVYVHTPGHANSTTEAIYEVYSGGQLLATIDNIDQTIATATRTGSTDGWWRLPFDLPITLSGSELTVCVKKEHGSEGVLRTDSVGIERVAGLTLSGGDFTVNETALVGTEVGFAVATALNVTEPISYAISDGNDEGIFDIDTVTGLITVVTAGILNTSAMSLYSLQVTATSGLLAASALFQIGVNHAPVITAVLPQETTEGENATLQVIATDAEDPVNALTFSAANLPSGLTMDNSGLITGRVRYDAVPANAVVAVQITATDTSGVSTVVNFNWTVIHAGIENLVAVEYREGVATSNQLVASNLAGGKLTIASGSTVKLFVGADGIPLPVDSDIEFVATAANPAGGDFTSTPTITMISPLSTILAGVDDDLSSTVVGNEFTHRLTIEAVELDVTAKRLAGSPSGGPAEPTAYPLLAGEHLEIGGIFEFSLTTPSLQGGTISYTLWDVDGINQILQAGQGTSFTYQFGNFNPLDAGGTQVWFFADLDNDGSWDSGEDGVKSETFEVVPVLTRTYTAEVSDAIFANPAGAPASPAQLAVFQADVNARLSAQNDLLMSKDSADDYRAAVTIIVNVIGSFAPSGARPDPANTQERRDFHFAMPHNITFVSDLGNLRGQAELGGDSVLVDWFAQATDTIVHEIGHTLGLEHDDSSSMNIMATGGAFRNPASNRLSQSYASTYDGN